jgi:uncharacterized membrane protein
MVLPFLQSLLILLLPACYFPKLPPSSSCGSAEQEKLDDVREVHHRSNVTSIPNADHVSAVRSFKAYILVHTLHGQKGHHEMGKQKMSTICISIVDGKKKPVLTVNYFLLM